MRDLTSVASWVAAVMEEPDEERAHLLDDISAHGSDSEMSEGGPHRGTADESMPTAAPAPEDIIAHAARRKASRHGMYVY